MTLHDLHRSLAPLTPRAWREIEDVARHTLQTYLAGRQLVDFQGPLGWECSAVPTGRTRALQAPWTEGVEARRRDALPLLELRAVFTLERAELDTLDRGGQAPDLAPVTHAATRLARAEDELVFGGCPELGMGGMERDSAHEEIALVAADDGIPRAVAEAIEVLHEQGIGGPYALAIGPDCYTCLSRANAPGGYPVLAHVERWIAGTAVWAPTLPGALLASQRGGDFELAVGRDVSIGYLDHDRTRVHLYLEESVAFRLLAPEAAVPLRFRG